MTPDPVSAPDAPVATHRILAPELPAAADSLRAAITAAWDLDETRAVSALLAQSAEGSPSGGA